MCSISFCPSLPPSLPFSLSLPPSPFPSLSLTVSLKTGWVTLCPVPKQVSDISMALKKTNIIAHIRIKVQIIDWTKLHDSPHGPVLILRGSHESRIIKILALSKCCSSTGPVNCEVIGCIWPVLEHASQEPVRAVDDWYWGITASVNTSVFFVFKWTV